MVISSIAADVIVLHVYAALFLRLFDGFHFGGALGNIVESQQRLI